MTRILLFLLVIISLYKYTYALQSVNNFTYHAFDLQLYEDVLDPVLCQEQLSYLRKNDTVLLTAFMDAGIRIPKGVLGGNFHDMGNYYQCLGISERIPNSVIEGKYCSISVPLDFWYSLSKLFGPLEIPWRDLDVNKFSSNEAIFSMEMFEKVNEGLDILRLLSNGLSQGLLFNLAICIPKVCTTGEAISGLLLNATPIDFVYQDNFCRLPNDKHWVPADYVAVVIFSLIGFLTILSTSYDVYYSVIRKTDQERINKNLITFSVYTNTRRLVTYVPVPGTLHCLDGIRAIAIMWVVMGHTFSMYFTDLLANPAYAFEYMMSWKFLFITAAPITVDTFFTLSGLLLVYMTAEKFTQTQLLKKLHLFYLNRLLRMFPILATFVLAQASILNRVADGPHWKYVASYTYNCRRYWWSTLLYIQNFLKFENTCLHHTWYLAVDMQLYIISPILLYWVLNRRKLYSWSALLVALSCAMISASIYNIKMRFPSAVIVPSRLHEFSYYMVHYYINPLARSPPFFIGMIYGYMLHLNRNKKVLLSKLQVSILWTCSIVIMGTAIYSAYPVLQVDWDNQTVDTLINCLMKGSWALAIGWLVFACTHGYGGPINWFLSLRIWKVPSRLSYAIYIIHYPLLIVVNSTVIAPAYFTMAFAAMHFIEILALTIIISFIVVVLIDAPCFILTKQFLGTGLNRTQNQSMGNELLRSQPVQGSINNAFIPDTSMVDMNKVSEEEVHK